MSKLKVQMKSKTQITKFNIKQNILTLSHFGIHLTFACLREAAPAKAGILTFELFIVFLVPATPG
jgi:hypothetical protein